MMQIVWMYGLVVKSELLKKWLGAYPESTAVGYRLVHTLVWEEDWDDDGGNAVRAAVIEMLEAL